MKHDHRNPEPTSTTSTGTTRACAAFAFAGLLGAFVLTPACSETAESYCGDFCSAYVACLDDHPDLFDERALFCGKKDTRQARCEASCASSLEMVGNESAYDLTVCGRCLIDRSPGAVCGLGDATEAAQRSCTDECESYDVQASAAILYDNLYDDVLKSTVCERPGVETWDANDADIGHRMGESGPDGSWVCDPCDTSWHVFYGPTLPTLPPGRYRAGARNVRLTGGTPTRTVGILEVGYQPDTWPFQVTLEPSDFPDGVAAEIAVDFELTTEKTNVQPRWSYYADNGATALTIGEIFVERK